MPMTAKLVRPVLALVLTTGLALSACGGGAAPTVAPTQTPISTPTATPTATPEPTPTPTPEPTPTPTSEPTQATVGFAFPPADVIEYYEGIEFECDEPTLVATGYSIVQCLKTAKGTPTAMISIAWSTDTELTQYGYAGYYNKAGAKLPDKTEAFEHLGGYIGALLGADEGGVVGQWVLDNFGTNVEDTYNGLNLYSYPLDEDPGSGYFIEVATPEFLEAVRS